MIQYFMQNISVSNFKHCWQHSQMTQYEIVTYIIMDKTIQFKHKHTANYTNNTHHKITIKTNLVWQSQFHLIWPKKACFWDTKLDFSPLDFCLRLSLLPQSENWHQILKNSEKQIEWEISGFWNEMQCFELTTMIKK